MSALHRFIPTPRLVEVDQEEIRARASDAYRAARHFDMGRSVLIRALFWLRRLPDRWSGELDESQELALDALDKSGPGFRLLADEPGTSFVVGAIGRFWEPHIEFVDVPREDFAAFATPGYGKVAWELRAESRGPDRTRLVLELRLDATDDRSWNELSRYYRLLGPFSQFIRRHAMGMLARELGEPALSTGLRAGAETEGSRSLLADVGEGFIGALGAVVDFATPFLQGAKAHWGIDEEAALRPYPGDERVPSPRWGFTHGIEIDAEPRVVWPELMRALARDDRRGSTFGVGDVLNLATGVPSLPVVAVEEGRYILAHLDSTLPAGPLGGKEKSPRFVRASWLLLVEPLAFGRSRCISRYRVACSDDLATRLTVGPHVTEAVGFAFDRKMLLDVKARVERRGRARPTPRRPGAFGP